MDRPEFQGFDAELATAFHRVAVPEGLAERVLARLEVESPAITIELGPLEEPSRPARRRFVWISAALAASLLLAVGGWKLWPRSEQTVDDAYLVEDWNSTLGEDWRELPAPAKFVFPKSIAARARRWQQAAARLGDGVVFDVSRSNLDQARLFVVKSTLSVPCTEPPTSPRSTTAGRAGAAWRAGAFVYVLVVKGSSETYRRFITDQNLAGRSLPDRHDRPSIRHIARRS